MDTHSARVIYAIAVWHFFIGVVVQVFLTGHGLMVDAGSLAAHQAMGYLVLPIADVILEAGLLRGLPRGMLAMTALLTLLARSTMSSSINQSTAVWNSSARSIPSMRWHSSGFRRSSRWG
jgi:hypothetical protein